jgi:hypothetical protein
MNRIHAILVAVAVIVLAGCGPAVSTPTGTPTAAVTLTMPPKPAETSNPTPTETPTSTPDVLVGVDYRNPATFPAEIKAYWKTGNWPSEADQNRLSTEFFKSLYIKILTDAGWKQTDIEALTSYNLYSQAVKIANEQGYVLTADLNLTRQMVRSSQGVANLNIEGGRYGIIAINQKWVDLNDLVRVTNGYNYDLPVFGQDVTIHRSPSGKILTNEAFLTQVSQDNYVLIAHYFNTSPIDGKTYEHFLPVSIMLMPTQITKSINTSDVNNPWTTTTVSDLSSPETVIGTRIGFNLKTPNFWDLKSLLLALTYFSGGGITIGTTSASTISGNGLYRGISSGGLEIAVDLDIPQKPAAAPSPTPTP